MGQAFITRRDGGMTIKPHLVGGITQPSNPKNNTIWANTSVTLTGRYELAESAPSTVNGASPQAGDLWLKTGSGGIYPIFKGVAVPVCLVSVYSGTSWVNTSASFYNGSWSIICLMLLDGSNKHNEVHGGWNRFYSYVGAPSEISTGLRFDWGGTESFNAQAGFQTVNMINLSGFTSLIFELTVDSTVNTCYVGAGTTVMACIFKNGMQVNNTDNVNTNIYTHYTTHAGGGTKALIVNVSGVSAARYVGLGGKGRGTATKIYLI